MLLGVNSTVQERIVLTLARHGSVSGTALRSNEVLKHFTKQALYQELRSLVREGVVIKAAGVYSLRFAWILAFRELSNTMYRSATSLGTGQWIPESGKLSWYVHDIPQALSLWTHVSMLLMKEKGYKQALEWAPHAWYHLVSTDVEIQFQDTLKREDVSFFLIVGNDSYLDRTYVPYFKIAGSAISFADSPFAKLEREYFSVVGDYLIRVVLPGKLAGDLHRIYEATTGAEKLNLGELNRALHAKARIKVEVIHTPQRTKVIRKTFSRFFGRL